MKEQDKELVHLRKRLLTKIGRANKYFNIFGDKKAFVVGISGGLDSIGLVDLVYHFFKRINRKAEIHAVFVDNHFKTLKDEKFIENFLKEREINFVKIEDSESKLQIEKQLKPFNPCFICTRNRRKLILQIAEQKGITRILLGHTLDDVIETLLLNLFYSSEISTMLPIQPLFDGRFFIVRPLVLIEKQELIKYLGLMGIVEKLESECPCEKNNKRTLVRKILQELYAYDPTIKKSLKYALVTVNQDFLWTKFNLPRIRF